MIKHRLLVLLILLVGCQTLPTGEVTHSWLFVDDGQYNVVDNQLNITVAYNKQQRYYRVGAHDSWGTKHLDSRLIDVSIQLNDDIDKIQISADFQQNTTSGVLKSSSDRVTDNIKHQSSKNICVNPTGLPLNQLPANQETYQYHMTVCPDSLVITDKTSDGQCTIDLAAQNEDLIQLVSNGKKSLATHFAYSLQDKDGSVLLWEQNYGDFSDKDTIDIYHLSCSKGSHNNATYKNGSHKKSIHIKTVSIKELDPRFNLNISHYETPTILANYSNQNYQRIMSLSGDVLKDRLERSNKGWKTLFLPDKKYLYDIDIDYNHNRTELRFDIIINRYNYSEGITEARRITVNQPGQYLE